MKSACSLWFRLVGVAVAMEACLAALLHQSMTYPESRTVDVVDTLGYRNGENLPLVGRRPRP